MKTVATRTNKHGLPETFKPILWSYVFAVFNPKKSVKTLIVQTINYGSLNQWRWIIDFYGKERVVEILQSIPASQIRPGARKLASLLLNIENFNYAQRGAHQ